MINSEEEYFRRAMIYWHFYQKTGKRLNEYLYWRIAYTDGQMAAQNWFYGWASK